MATTFYVDCQKEGDLPSADFKRLVGLIKSGISKYWSRSITVGSDSFNVKVDVVIDEQPRHGAPNHGRDLMQYYTDREPADYYARVIAAEVDVKRAIASASIDFDD